MIMILAVLAVADLCNESTVCDGPEKTLPEDLC